MLPTTPAAANRFRDNPERVVDRAKETWTSPIGELQSRNHVKNPANPEAEEFVLMGTGVLVSPCYIVTAAHVPFGHDIEPIQGKDYRMTFRAGTSASAAFAGNTTATPVIIGERDNFSGGDDWALMKLNNCVGSRPELGWYESAAKLPRELVGLRAISLGYEADAPRGSLFLGSGHFIDIDRRRALIMFDGSMQPGSSGGPVLILSGGALKIAAVNVAEIGSSHGATYERFSRDTANLSRSTDFLSKTYIRALLEADKAAFGRPNPAAERLRMDHLPQ